MENLLGQIEYEASQAPDDHMFALWRAVFSLAHVDGEVADSERELVEEVMNIFSFTDEQRQSVQEDMKDAGNTLGLFQAIALPHHRAQFFRLARVMIWCDGFLHEDEMAIIEAIKTDLGDEVVEYERDLRWMNRKPDLPIEEVQATSSEEEMMKHIIYQMIAFYEEQEGPAHG